MESALDPVTRLVRACDPTEALSAGDPRYVNCDDVRGEALVDSYARSLRRADPARPEVKLFAGHRGVGKTCELNRLKARLETAQSKENPHPPFKVVYIDTADRLDLNDLDLPDLLVLIAHEVQKQLQEAEIPGFSILGNYLTRVWDEIRVALGSKVDMKEVKVDAAFGELTLELRNRPGARQVLREAIERHSTRLLDAVNDLLNQATVKLRETNRAGLVLIVDGLERLVFRKVDGTNTHDRLFLDRREQLASLRAHTVYTVPISLFYSPACAQLEQTLGEHNVPVPMIRLHEFEESKVVPESPGMRKLGEMIEARCRYAEVESKYLFDRRETGHYLCEMTGGHPRHLVAFLQAALNEVDRLPITRAAAEKAVRKYANSLLREMPEEYWEKLRQFRQPRREMPKDEDHQQMLFLLHLFEYMNGEPWYEVNPVIRALPRFAAKG